MIVSAIVLSLQGSVCHIDLEKQPSGELGISLVTAVTENQTGVYVCTISAGGVAHIDGRLSVGDKILQVGIKTTVYGRCPKNLNTSCLAKRAR